MGGVFQYAVASIVIIVLTTELIRRIRWHTDKDNKERLALKDLSSKLKELEDALKDEENVR